MVGIGFAEDEHAPGVSVGDELGEPVPTPADDGGPPRGLQDEQRHEELDGHTPEHGVPVDLQERQC